MADRDVGKKFLNEFIDRLMDSNDTTAQLVLVMDKVLRQNAVLINQYARLIKQADEQSRMSAHLSRQMDGLAARADQLAYLLYEDYEGDDDDRPRSRPQLPPPHPASLGEQVREVVGQAAGDLFYGRRRRG